MENIQRNTGDPDQICLKYLTIDRSECQQITADLQQHGIDESSVYPDLEGIARLLKRVAPEYANGKNP